MKIKEKINNSTDQKLVVVIKDRFGRVMDILNIHPLEKHPKPLKIKGKLEVKSNV